MSEQGKQITVAWKARATYVGVSSALRTHGEVKVPDSATDEEIDALVRADMVRGFKFEWRRKP
ncbi:hypothetical protein I6F35_33430 [Bradyrhizobium sp. BRP22]|uniref:hypothetical protein n=1 Tax=Bradyrhizobium sp. BRP22 TaxID=2793821 RepID=UPI001CD2BF8A|nr:hypothetical protein [Bradyrhizobium sp. BRP22]MCA1458037.1 hypothetical protein [Bradyrhizobium sp. BRP22]